MTEKEYYANPRVSSSSLKWFEESPRYFKAKLDKEIEEESKSYFEIGKKVHMRLLEPEEYSKNYIYLDVKLPKSDNQKKFCDTYLSYKFKGTKDSKLIDAYKANYTTSGMSDDKILEAANKIYKDLTSYLTYLKKRIECKDVLTHSDHTYIEDAYKLVQEHCAAKQLLYLTEEDKLHNVEEHNEFVIFFEWNIEDTKIPCKAMIDRFVVDYDNKIVKLIDVKTTGKINSFQDSFESFKYYRQLAFYWLALGNYFKHEKGINIFDDEWKHESYIVAIGKGEFTSVKVFKPNESWLNTGYDELYLMMPQIAWHFDTNQWEHSREYYENQGIEKL